MSKMDGSTLKFYTVFPGEKMIKCKQVVKRLAEAQHMRGVLRKYDKRSRAYYAVLSCSMTPAAGYFALFEKNVK
jgi:hypothetical protein